jgi:thiol-disulfide isomerase/thioredoxin
MKRWTSAILFWIAAIVLLPAGCAYSNRPSDGGPDSLPTQSLGYTEDWETIPASEAGLPMMSKDDVVAKIKNQIAAFKTLTPWETRYRATFKQTSPLSEEEIRVRMVSDNRRWYWRVKWNNSRWSNTMEAASDGNSTRMIWPDVNEAQFRQAAKSVALGNTPPLPDFLPQLPGADALRRKWRQDIPDILEILTDPQIRLLPVCTRVDGRMCFILERTWKLEYPLFKDKVQADQWSKEHSRQEVAYESFAHPAIIVDPNAKTGQKVTYTIAIRLALDPNLGFAIVRCATKLETQRPKFQYSVFPEREIKYSDFHKVGDGLYLPWKIEFTVYRGDAAGSKKEINQQSLLTVEDFVNKPELKAELFAPSIPDGYKITDNIRKIVYKAGDSKEKIDALAAAAKARDNFYSQLRQQPAPSLEASQWLNSNPIDLAAQKGRPVILHFWGIGCVPCMRELSRLQGEFGDTIKSSQGPLFVSIHPHVDSNNLDKLRKVIKEKGITFPVMIDSPYDEFQGKTFYKYRIFSIPSEIKIATNGHLSEIPDEEISEGVFFRWLDNSDIKYR